MIIRVPWCMETSPWSLPSSSQRVLPMSASAPNFSFLEGHQLYLIRSSPHSFMTSSSYIITAFATALLPDKATGIRTLAHEFLQYTIQAITGMDWLPRGNQ